jgi:hypothetical protein
VTLNSADFNWGFTLQYGLPYKNFNVSELGGLTFSSI